jgi:hypothetical protein
VTELTADEIQEENEALSKAYLLTFRTPWGQKVMLDLMKFCNFRVDLPDDNMEIEEGKRRVFLRIQSFLSFTPEELGRLFAGQPIPNQEKTE